MSANEYEDHGYLLAVIPSCRPEQVAHWDHGRPSPTYKLLRKPVNLDELNRYNYSIAIWRDNETLTYVTPYGSDEYPDDDLRCLHLHYHSSGPNLSITGLTDEAVIETATFFMGLETPTQNNSCVAIGTGHFDGYDFREARVQCLRHLFDVAPLRPVSLQNVTLSASQSIFLATRPHPTWLTLCRCHIDDEGTAFVDALEDRKSTFGTLEFEATTAINDYNLKRLLQIDMIDRLDLPELKEELALLPFYTKAKHLVYEISSSSSLLMEAKLQSLHIEDGGTFPTEPVLSFLRRLAELGHFVELHVRFHFYDDESAVDMPDCVVEELIRTVMANSKLQVFNLSTGDADVEWDSHVEALFEGLKDHKALRTLKLHVDKSAFVPDYSHLRQFISDNRNITVVDGDGDVYLDDDGVIDELYSLNRFYRGSAGLVVESPSERSSLVATALTERAWSDFQRSALLLSNHTDALYELVQYARLDELSDEAFSTSFVQGHGEKRRRTV